MLKYLYNFNFTSLFIHELGWDYPRNKEIELSISNQKYILKSLAEKYGFVIYECKATNIKGLPNISTRRRIHENVSEYTYEHLLIFTDSEYFEQIWQLTNKINNQTIYSEYLFQSHKDNRDLLTKISSLYFSILEEYQLNLFKVVKRVQQAFGYSESNIFISPKKIEPKISETTYFSIAKRLIELSIPYRLVEIDYEFEYVIRISNILEFDDDLKEVFMEILEVKSNIFSWNKLIDVIRENDDEILASLSKSDRNLIEFKYGITNNYYWDFYRQSDTDDFYNFYYKDIAYSPSEEEIIHRKNREDNKEKVNNHQEQKDNIDLSKQSITELDKIVDLPDDDDNISKGIEPEELDIFQEANRLNNLGIEFINSREYEKALAEFNKAIDFNPNLYEAWYNQGVSLKYLNRYTDAVSSFYEAFRLASNDFDIPYEIACCHALQNQVKKSVEYLKIAISFSSEMYLDKARNDSDFDLIRERATFKALVTTDEEKIAELYLQAKLLVSQNLYHDAIIIYDKLLKLNLYDVELIFNKAVALFMIDSYVKSITYLKYALELDNENYNVWNFLGLVNLHLSDYDQAFTCYSQSLRIKPDSDEALYGKGLVYSHLDMYQEAAQCFEQAIFVNPQNQSAIEELNKVNKILEAQRNKIIEQERKQREEAKFREEMRLQKESRLREVENKRKREEVKRKDDAKREEEEDRLRKAENRRRQEEVKRKSEEKERADRERRRKQEERDRNKDPVTKIFDFVRRLFF